MYKTAAAGGATMVLVFLVLGGAFVSLGTFLPDGLPRNVVTVALGFIFAGAFVALLVSRVKALFADNDRLWTEIGLAMLNVALLLLAFAAIYRVDGIEDASGPGGPTPTRDFFDCLYYSVVTFTTLGYGDFQPAGVAKILAALQAFVGYLVLGILASSSASVIQQKAEDDAKKEGEQKGRDQQKQEDQGG